MRVVNLARRPFANRRPVVRLTVLLWVLGAAFLGYNVWLFAKHWQGTAANRAKLHEIDQQIREEEQQVSRRVRKLNRLDLNGHNTKGRFLNTLISYRTFPWSALFDDLEQILPPEVRLTSVQPAVRLVGEVQEPARQSRRPSRNPRRRSARDKAEQEETAEEVAAREAAAEAAAQSMRRDRVELRISGVAKTDAAINELINTLFKSPAFGRPFLPSWSQDPASGNVGFTINVIYRTRFSQARIEAEHRPEGSPSGEAAPGEVGLAEATAPSGELGEPVPAADVADEAPAGEVPEPRAEASPSRAGAGRDRPPDGSSGRPAERDGRAPPRADGRSRSTPQGVVAGGTIGGTPVDPAIQRVTPEPAADPATPEEAEPVAEGEEPDFDSSDASSTPRLSPGESGARLFRQGPFPSAAAVTWGTLA